MAEAEVPQGAGAAVANEPARLYLQLDPQLNHLNLEKQLLLKCKFATKFYTKILANKTVKKSCKFTIWLLSLDVHLTTRGLDRYMKEKPDGEVIVDLGQDLSRAHMSLASTYITYMSLLNECSTNLGIPSEKV